jgi:hypothetical protein
MDWIDLAQIVALYKRQQTFRVHKMLVIREQLRNWRLKKG